MTGTGNAIFSRAFILLLSAALCLSSACKADEEAFTVPFDFLMDVMKPVGMPVVTSYHSLRENFFFNVSLKEKGTLESIGDFFLTPSQFLFAGKTLAIHNERSVELTQSFDYDHAYWLKAILSLLVLPIAEPIGASIKGLAYLFPDVRNRHNQIKELLSAASITSHLEHYHQKGIKTFHSDTFIPCQNHKRPAQLTKRQAIELDAFKEIASLLDAHNIIYWVDCGTCLGSYRHGGIIPWDIDIDIAIFQADHDNVKRLLSTLDPEKYQIQDWSSYSKPKTFLKLYVKETQNLIDIYHYQFDENDQTISYFYSYEDSPFPDSWKKIERKCTKPLRFDQVFPLKRAQFDGLLVWAPNHVEEYLQSKYGENLDPAMVWDEESKSFLKAANHPYWND